jgi:hypothetical protein
MTAMDQVNERERRRLEGLAMFDDYLAALSAYADWMDDFRKRTGRMHPLLPLSHETAFDAMPDLPKDIGVKR